MTDPIDLSKCREDRHARAIVHLFADSPRLPEVAKWHRRVGVETSRLSEIDIHDVTRAAEDHESVVRVSKMILSGATVDDLLTIDPESAARGAVREVIRQCGGVAAARSVLDGVLI